MVVALADSTAHRLGQGESRRVEDLPVGAQLQPLAVGARDREPARLGQFQLQVDDVARYQPIDGQQPVAWLHSESFDRRAWLDGTHHQPGQRLGEHHHPCFC